jgi:hypothetical protein
MINERGAQQAWTSGPSRSSHTPSDTPHWVPTHQSVSQRAFDTYYSHFICARPALGIASGPLARTMTGWKMDRPPSAMRHHRS